MRRRRVGPVLRTAISRCGLAVALAVAAASAAVGAPGPQGLSDAAPLEVQVAGLGADGTLPVRATRDGRNLSPAISWSAAPGARGYVVLMRDAGAGAGAGEAGVHWMVYDLAPEVQALPGGLRNVALLDKPAGAAQGWNGHGSLGYSGPAGRPGDPPHPYRFEVFAVGRPLRLPPGARVDRVMAALRGRVIAHGEAQATYAAPPATPAAAR